MKGLTTPCRVKVNAAGDWQIMPPAGQITQIGDAAATAWGLVANDDLFVSGMCESGGPLYVGGDMWLSDDLGIKTAMSMYGSNEEVAYYSKEVEEITIPVGQGFAGVDSVGNMFRVDSAILGVVGRVTQAPGGGATNFNVGRELVGNNDEYAQAIAVALGTTFVSPTNGDGADAGPHYNAADQKLTIDTDANVTISDMKIRVTVFYIKFYPPDD